MSTSRSRSRTAGGLSGHSRNQSANGHGSLASSSRYNAPTNTSSNEATAFHLALQDSRNLSGHQEQVQGILERGTSPLLAATSVDARRAQRSPQPDIGSHNTLQLPPADRSRSLSPALGYPRALSPHSPHLSPNMLPRGLMSPPNGGFNSFASMGTPSFDSADDSRRGPQPDPSPGGDSSYSFAAEKADYARQKAEKAERSRQSRTRRSKKADDPMYQPDGEEPDSDDNPDHNRGVVPNGGLAHRAARQRNTSIPTDYLGRPLKPSSGRSKATSMAAVQEDEGLDAGSDVDFNTTPMPEPSHSPYYHRPPKHIHLVESGTPLPHTYRQQTEWEHLLREAWRWCRRWYPALAGAVGVVWLAFLLRGVGAPKASPTSPAPLPSNFNELAGRLGSLESSLADSASGHSHQWDSLDARLSRLEASQPSVSDLAEQQQLILADNRRTKKQMGTTIDRLDKLEGRVDTLEGLIPKAIDDGSLRNALDRILPEIMPVVRGKNGEWIIHDSFHADMKRLLVGTGPSEQEIRHLINQGLEVERQRWSADRHPDSQRLSDNLDKLFSNKVAEWQTAFITRQDFIELFEEKIEGLKREIKTVQANAQAAPQTIKIKTSDGQDMTEVIQAVVDASLLRYGNDKLGLPDFALYSAGARVIETTTSATLQLSNPGWMGRMWGSKPVYARPPNVALHPDTTVGQCWAFSGPSGDLSVLLAHPKVVVSAITIDHVAKALATDISSAPKEVEVWVTIEGEENLAKARRYLEVSPYRDEPTSLPQTPENILLTKVAYDIYSATPIQTFPVPDAFVDFGIDTRIVTFRVQSNWGGDVTCLYRIRVHGTPVEDAESA